MDCTGTDAMLRLTCSAWLRCCPLGGRRAKQTSHSGAMSRKTPDMLCPIWSCAKLPNLDGALMLARAL